MQSDLVKTKNRTPRISIVLPVYNGSKHLKKTLESIAQQTQTDWELIAIDDASTDKTYAMLVDFKQSCQNCVTILQQQKNVGITASLIRGIQIARGEYIARIDSGDTFLPEKLEKQLFFLESHPEYGIVGTNGIQISIETKKEKKINLPIENDEIQTIILKKNPFLHSAIMLRKHIYETAGGYNKTILFTQDYELWFRILRITKGANLPEYLCVRLIDTQDSISNKKHKKQIWYGIKVRWSYISKRNLMQYHYLVIPLLRFLVPKKIKIAILKKYERLHQH